MEYFREANNQIQAGIALRIGKLLAQYIRLRNTLTPDESYEATLTVCALQTLLTTCSELRRTMDDHRKRDFRTRLGATPDRWGLQQKFIIEDTFPRTNSGWVLNHMRDAFSHPSVATAEYPPATGYTTITNESGSVSDFQFTNSPWVDKGRIVGWACGTNREKVESTVEKFERDYGGHDLEVLGSADGNYYAARKGERYLPTFVIRLPLQTMIDLTLELSNYLAQAANKRWDGGDIVPLVA